MGRDENICPHKELFGLALYIIAKNWKQLNVHQQVNERIYRDIYIQ